MSYYVHNLKLEGIVVQAVERYRIQGSVGTHATLELIGYVTEDAAFYHGIEDFRPITLYLEQPEQKQVLFSGVITAVDWSCNHQIKTIKVIAKSYSYLLDIQKRSRSFQDIQMSYSTLLNEVFNQYQGMNGLVSIEDRVIGELIVQYEETDWEFLKRILSKLETTLTPAAQYSGIYLYVDTPELNIYEIPYQILEIEKDLDSYYYLKANQQQVYETDYLQIRIQTTGILRIFDQILVKQQRFLVGSYCYEYDGRDFNAYYRLYKKAGMKQKCRYPMHLIGVAVSGVIARTKQDKVQVYLDIDGAGNGGQYWFPYSTVSASTDGSGWYCMPEVGDCVRIYFPSKYTNQAIALSAVSNYQAGGGAADKMSDPSVKYLSTRHNKEVILSPKHLKINCNDNASLTMDKEGKVTFLAKNMIQLYAEDSIHLAAAGNVTVEAEQKVLIGSGAGGSVELQEDGMAVLRGTEVKLD